MSKSRGNYNRQKFNSPSSDDCPCPDTPASSKLIDRLSQRINARECKSRKNIDARRVNRSCSSGYEKPRIDKRYTSRDTCASPVVKVTSVEVIKSWSRDCRSRRKNGEKLMRDSSSNRSSSSSIINPRNTIQKIKSQNLKSKKSELDSCGCCDCVEKLQDERLKLVQNSKRLEKSRGNLTPQQSGYRPQSSPGQTQKLCSMLKTREAKRIIGCTCINNDWNANCTIDCRCPEGPVDMPNKVLSKESKRSTLTTNNMNIPANDNYPSDHSCSCDDSSPDRYHYSSSPMNLRDLQPAIVAPDDWKKCGEYLKKFSNEYRILSSHLRSIRREIDAVKKPGEIYGKRITRQYPGKEFSFEVRSTGDNSNKKTTVNRSCQCTNTNSLSPDVLKWNEKKYRSQVIDQRGSNFVESFQRSNGLNQRARGRGKRKSNACRTSICDCKSDKVDEVVDKIENHENFNNGNKLEKNREKRPIRQHDFSLPRIAPVNQEGRGRDHDRMMIYPPKNEKGCPLTLYKSESFVNCSVKQVDVGFKYDVAYVQKYVSVPWRPGEFSEQDKSDYLSTDDYG